MKYISVCLSLYNRYPEKCFESHCLAESEGREQATVQFVFNLLFISQYSRNIIMSDNDTHPKEEMKENNNEEEQEEDEEEDEGEEDNDANNTEEDHSLTMPTDDGDDAFETIQQEFQEVLAELVKDKSMDAFRGEYEKLFNTLEKSNRAEKRLRTKCTELASEIAQHVAKVDLTNDKAKEDQETIESLKKEIEKAWKMVDTAQEGEERARETIETLNTEIQNLTKVIEEKTLGAEDTNINELRKIRDELTQQRDNLQLEVSELKTKYEANESEVTDLTRDKAELEKEIVELKQEAGSRNNEMNREMRRKERAERELKQLKADISSKEQELSEQSAAKTKMAETIDKQDKTLREQRDLGSSLESELDNVNEKFSKLQQDHENQMSLYQQLELELTRKSNELTEKEDIEIQIRSEVTKQSKDIESLQKKISGLEVVKKDLERDKEKLKCEAVEKNKEIESLKHQSLVDKKKLNILSAEKESVELRLERSAQNTKNDAVKLKNVEGAKGDLQTQMLQLEDQLDKQRRFIARLEEERDRYMTEGAVLSHKIDSLLEEVKNTEMTNQNSKKQIEEFKSELKKQQNLYHSVRNDRAQLTRAVTESHDEIADLKEKMKVLTHQFDQLKEEIIAKEMDLVKESQEKAKILKDKDGLMKEIERVRSESQAAERKKTASERQVSKLLDRERRLELQITNNKNEMGKTVARMEVVNSKLAHKKQGIDVLERKVNVQQKVIERGEVNYNDRVEDCRLLKLEIKRLKEDANFLEQDTKNMTSLKKEVLKLERELMQQKSRNKVLQTELENPLNVHRWRRLEGKDPETLELIQKINHLQKRLISKQEDLIDKDMKIEEIQKLYNEAKIQLSRQPKYDIHDEIRNLRDEVKRKNDKIIVLSTESNMYQIETSKAKKVMEGMNEELTLVMFSNNNLV